MFWLIPLVVGIALSLGLNLRFGSERIESDFILIYYGLFVLAVLLIVGVIWLLSNSNPSLQAKVGNWFWGIALTLGVPVAIGGVQSLLENRAKASANALIQTRAELVFSNTADGVYGIVFDQILEPSTALKDKVWGYTFGSSKVLHIKSGYISNQQDFVGQSGDSLPNWLRLHTRFENGTALSFLQAQCGDLLDEKFKRIGVICHVYLPGYTLEELSMGKGGYGQDLERIRGEARAKPAQ